MPNVPAHDPATARPALADAIVALLTARGPLTQDELAGALTEAGLAEAHEASRLLDDALAGDDLPHVLMLTDLRVAYLPALLAGRVFTHRLTAAEVAHDLVDVSPDLEPLSIMTEAGPYQQLAGGGELLEAFAEFDPEVFDMRDVAADERPDTAWLLPEGTLAGLGLTAGDLIAFGAGPTGWLVAPVSADDVRPAPGDLGPRLLALIQAHGAPAEIADVVWAACADDPTLFLAPLPPLGTLLADLGLAFDHDLVAPAGFDFDGWRVASQITRVREDYELDEDQALAVVAAAALLRFGAEASADNDVRATLGSLADPEVCEAVLVECLGDGRDEAPALIEDARGFEPTAPRDARPALRWLQAKALERMGAVAEAEKALDAAESLDPDWPPTLFDLARYASDRGDAERGLLLLERAGADPKDGLAVLLDRFRTEGGHIARNEPCWCGSGRKSKQCHRGPAPLPLSERATWLYGKAGMYLEDGPWRAEHVELAYVRAADWEGDKAVLRAMVDPIVGDALLFEGGAFAEFVAERGFLLPPDELELAQQWLLVRRSVFEVEAVEAGRGLTVRDLLSQDRHELAERRLSGVLEVGDLLCARVVPAGDTMRIFGGLEPVDARLLDPLLALLGEEPDPFQVVQILSLRFAPKAPPPGAPDFASLKGPTEAPA